LPYTKNTWTSWPDTSTPISKTALDHMEAGIADASITYNVKSYGATGDGVTDDTTACQDAIDAAEAAGGGIVFFPVGSYLVSGLVVNADNVIAAGAGWGSILQSSSAVDLITFLNVDSCGLRDMFLLGSWNGSRGVVLEGARWGTFLNILGDEFTEPMLDMRADGAATQNVNNNLLVHIHAYNAVRFIRLKGDSSNYVTLNTFQNVSAVGAGTVASTLIDFAAYADTNAFSGVTRLALNYAGSYGIIFNSDAPSSIRDIYSNRFDRIAVDSDAAGTTSVQVNNTDSAFGVFPNVFQTIRIGGSDPAPPVLAGSTSYASVGFLGSFPTAGIPPATTHLPGAFIWDSTAAIPKWSNGSAWFGVALASDIATHEADTTAIHGIADTSVLLTTSTKLDDLAAPDDNTDLNASTSKHGLLPKLSNVSTQYLNGVGAFASPYPTTLFVWADDMLGAGGSTANTNVNRWVTKGFDQTAVEYASKMVTIPPDWTTFNLSILWANGGAGSGDVGWTAGVGTVGAIAAESLTSPTFGASTVVTAGAQNVVISTALLTGQSANAAKNCLIAIRRDAADVPDTLGNDANLIAVVLTKAS